MSVNLNVNLLCVYYKVDAAQHAACGTRARQFQATLKADFPDLRCELLQRPEVTAGVETWMETYCHPDGLNSALMGAIAQAAVAAGLPSPRHTEQFVALR